MQGYLDTVLGDPTPVRGGKSIKYYMLTEKAYSALEEVKAIHDRLWENVIFPVKRI